MSHKIHCPGCGNGLSLSNNSYANISCVNCKECGYAALARGALDELMEVIVEEIAMEQIDNKRCPYNDCGWCYAPEGVDTNDDNGRCNV